MNQRMQCLPGSRFSAAFLLLCGLLTIVGCAENQPQCSVSGTVTFQGQPVTRATVILFSPETGKSSAGMLDEQGQFTLQDKLAPGEYVATILSDSGEETLGSGPRASVMNFPKKYISDTTSDLRVTLVPGANEFQWNLED